jgi:hypothetical protein
MQRTATCSCGQLSVTVTGEPQFAAVCSCLECQKATGSVFSYAGYWPRSSVAPITGRSTVWRRIADTGRWYDNHFCPVCGSTVFGYAEFDPDVIGVNIGNFADPHYPPPSFAVWNKFKPAWVRLPDHCEASDTQP